MLLLSVNGFDCVLLDEALQRFHIEPQRSTNLDAGNLPQPGFLVDGVYFQSQVLGGLPDIQEPPTDSPIRHCRGFHCHPPSYTSPTFGSFQSRRSQKARPDAVKVLGLQGRTTRSVESDVPVHTDREPGSAGTLALQLVQYGPKPNAAAEQHGAGHQADCGPPDQGRTTVRFVHQMHKLASLQSGDVNVTLQS